MADEWFYVVNKQKAGPVSFAQLRELVAHGRLNRADMLLQAGTSKWLTAETVDGLFPTAPTEGMDEAPPAESDLAVFEDATAVRVRHHQGDLIFGLGLTSIGLGLLGLLSPCLAVLSVGGLYLTVFSLMGLGLGVPTWSKASGDLRKMRSGLVDPAGESKTGTGRVCAMIGTALGVVGIVVMVLLQLGYVVYTYFIAAP